MTDYLSWSLPQANLCKTDFSPAPDTRNDEELVLSARTFTTCIFRSELTLLISWKVDLVHEFRALLLAGSYYSLAEHLLPRY